MCARVFSCVWVSVRLSVCVCECVCGNCEMHVQRLALKSENSLRQCTDYYLYTNEKSRLQNRGQCGTFTNKSPENTMFLWVFFRMG